MLAADCTLGWRLVSTAAAAPLSSSSRPCRQCSKQVGHCCCQVCARCRHPHSCLQSQMGCRRQPSGSSCVLPGPQCLLARPRLTGRKLVRACRCQHACRARLLPLLPPLLLLVLMVLLPS